MATSTTTTRKQAQAATAAPRRSALRAQAATAPASSATLSPPPMEDTAAYAIGYQSGLIEGQHIGAARERTRLNTDEEIGDRINRMLANEMYPLRERATDHAMAMLIYSGGLAAVVGFFILIWRLLRWA